MSQHHEPTSDEMKPKEMAKSAASKLFDLRIMIGALFTFYGIVLTLYGFFTPPEDIAKAAGIHINLWLASACSSSGCCSCSGRGCHRSITVSPRCAASAPDRS